MRDVRISAANTESHCVLTVQLTARTSGDFPGPETWRMGRRYWESTGLEEYGHSWDCQ